IEEVVCALRAIYKFEKLPENYIDDKREMLLKDPSKLKKECGKFFPVMDRSKLKLVNKRKQELRKYYFFTKLPESYFILLPKKQELLLAYQELTPSLRKMFTFCSRDGEDFKEHVKELRKVYAFKYLPNNYLINKRRLPVNPQDLGINVKEGFSIKNKEEALSFIQAIPSYYRKPNPMLRNYIDVNYTELEDLPKDWNKVDKVNLTLPISNMKELRIAIQVLREYYFFYRIPEDWIKIKEAKELNKNEANTKKLPSDLEELRKDLKQKQPDCQLAFPITRQKEI